MGKYAEVLMRGRIKLKSKYIYLLILFTIFIPNLVFASGKPKLYIDDVVKYENSNKVTLNILH